MGQTSFDAQISDATKPAKTLDTSSIQKFLEEHYSQQKITGTKAEKASGDIDLNKLFEKNPLYTGQDDNYIKKQWQAGAVDSPTDKQLHAAEDKLKMSVNPLLTDADRKALGQAQEAILKGNPDELKDVLNQYKNDPDALKAFSEELNKTLDKNGANLKMSVDGDTVSLSGMGGAGYADVKFDTHNGKVSASFGTLGRASFDGTISMDPETVMKRFGSNAVRAIDKIED